MATEKAPTLLKREFETMHHILDLVEVSELITCINLNGQTVC